MEDFTLHKVAISGPTLASMIQRVSSSVGDVDGLLFGHVTGITPSTLSDDDAVSPDSGSQQLVANVTSFICFHSPLSFYDSLGRVDSSCLRRFTSSPATHHHHFMGWFSARRKTPIRPSMREYSVTRSLSSKSELSFPIKDLETKTRLSPCVFLLFSTPLPEQVIHTHEYRAYQFRTSRGSLEPKPMDIVNIGPAFRGHYGSFSPNSPFPMLNCELRGSMNEDTKVETLDEKKQNSRDQSELDMCAEGFGIGNLRRLIGADASNTTTTLEDLYERMLTKIDTLAREVEISSSKVLEQENHNRKLRHKIARTSVE
ncbi:hypothetical protein K2173_008470 [Erythroxylum novogranatense]|uniref:BRCA1-A complex subunit Abraxas n=1 Tax=Erythroxylum novogranatense TaxID=1862640 RepID=A0AAV8U930_9ROSI|nr:hypothetical protein K2173_008470 [Erythroxylum novogranatense]